MLLIIIHKQYMNSNCQVAMEENEAGLPFIYFM